MADEDEKKKEEKAKEKEEERGQEKEAREEAKERKRETRAPEKQERSFSKSSAPRPEGDQAFILLIASVVLFAFIQLSGPLSTSLKIIFGIIFVIFSALLIEGGILTTATAIAGIVWWLVFKGDLYALLILGIILGIFALIDRKEDPTQQLLHGLIPLGIFAADTGLITVLYSKLSLLLPGTVQPTAFLNTIFKYMPWWVLYASIKTKRTGFLATTLRIGTVGYVILLVITMITPAGFDYQVLPGINEASQLQMQVEKELPKGEHPILSNLWCIFNEPTIITGCVQRRQEESQFAAICSTERELRAGTTEYKKCLAEQQEKKVKESLQAQGAVDSAITDYTTMELKRSADFPQRVYQPQYPLLVEFVARNPRYQEPDGRPTVEPNCYFAKDKIIIPGELLSEQSFSLDEEQSSTSIVCRPSQPLEKGGYHVTFEAVIHNLKTTTRLNRLFIGTGKTSEEKQQLRQEYFAGLGNSHLSRGPPELAKINFLVGEPPENPLIEGDNQLFFVSSIENSGKGELLSVQNVQFDFRNDLQVSPGSSDCLSPPGELKEGRKEHLLPLHICQVSMVNSQLQNPEHFIPREYEATLWYTYNLTLELPIEVVVIQS